MKSRIHPVVVTAFLVAVCAGAEQVRAAPGGEQATMPETPGAAPAGGAALPAVFRGDARLEAKVTVAEKNRPLGEVLTGVGAQIGVRLAASREPADDKVTLFLDGWPAAEALALTARQFGFQWKSRRGGYELTQDLAEREREAALREAGRAAQITAIQARMGQIARIVSTPREQWGARSNEIDRRLSDPSVTPEERATLAEEQVAFQDAERPGAAAAVAIYRALTPAQLALLRAGGEIRLSTADGSLPPPLADAARQAAAEQMQRNAERMAQRLQGGAADRGGSLPTAASPAGGPMGGEADVSVRFSTTGFRKGPPRPGGPPLQLRFSLTSDSPEGNRRRMFPVTWWPMLRPRADAAVAAATEPQDLQD